MRRHYAVKIRTLYHSVVLNLGLGVSRAFVAVLYSAVHTGKCMLCVQIQGI